MFVIYKESGVVQHRNVQWQRFALKWIQAKSELQGLLKLMSIPAESATPCLFLLKHSIMYCKLNIKNQQRCKITKHRHFEISSVEHGTQWTTSTS